jgi:predicted SAM-dependent methyltransferase
MMAAMNSELGVDIDKLVRGKDVVHFAPEQLVQNYLSPMTNSYRTADLYMKHIDLRLDLCNMSALSSSSVDLLIACDVLEHVMDDSVALNEIRRVLRSDGWAVLTVPQKDGLESKYEDDTITTGEERLAAFGQEDHLRIYGADFPEFVESHGFKVVSINEENFPDEQVKRNVLFPPVLSAHPLATNYRKVFFARKC